MKEKANPLARLAVLLLLVLGAGVSTAGFGQATPEEWMQALQQTIGQAQEFDLKKRNRIQRLRERLAGSAEYQLYDLYLAICEEYTPFNSDSAYAYARKLDEVALQSGDDARVAYARVKVSFVLLSSGKFKEALDLLSKIAVHRLAGPQKGEYYTLMARCYYDLADYNQDENYSPQYNARAKSYLDSALALFPAGSFQFRYYAGLQNIRAQHLYRAEVFLKSLLDDPRLTAHQTAIAASTLSDIYIRRTQVDTALALLARAAIADIQSATKETSAVFHLARLLFEQGDMEKASAFIHKAASDAHAYGARQRIMQLNAYTIGIIESQRSKQMQSEKNRLSAYAIGLTVSCLLLIALITMIVRQFRISKKQQDTIHKKNLSLQSLLGEKNALLHQKDGLLEEKEHLLEEKERLLREIHHRVKNNLQVVISLLNSQAALLKDQAALSAIQESQHRVHVMALIHQKLYQAQGVARIPMLAYMEEVVAYLYECYSLYGAVRFYTEADEIELDVTQAVPLGLIINEAVTNALKYAFPGDRPGQVMVALQRLEEGICRLVVADDGVGLPAGYDPSQSCSLGMTLLHGFSAQLGGDLTITSSRGLTITLVFQEEQLNPAQVRTSPVC